MPKAVDANHTAIVRVLRQLGCSVLDTHELGQGAPDIVCARNGVTVCVEIKNPKADGKLRPGQVVWHAGWKGWRAVIETEDDCIALVDAMAMSKEAAG